MLIGLAGPAGAAVLSVPTQYASISEAVASASDGDVIQISPGAYADNVVIDRPVTLLGAGVTPDDVVIVSLDDAAPTIDVTQAGVLTMTGLTVDGRAPLRSSGVVDAFSSAFRRFEVGVAATGGSFTATDVAFVDGSGTALVGVGADLTLDHVDVIATDGVGDLVGVSGGSLTWTDGAIRSDAVDGALLAVDAAARVVLTRLAVGCSASGRSAVVLAPDTASVVALEIADTTAPALLEVLGAAPVVRHATLLPFGAPVPVLLAEVAKTVTVDSSVLFGEVVVGAGVELVATYDLVDPRYPVSMGLGSVYAEDPGLVARGGCEAGLRAPQSGSPVVDAGDVAEFDRNGTRADIGATGGPDGFVVDGDLDGALSDVDCDDTDPGRAPGRTESPGDGIDQDCDGLDAPPGGTTSLPMDADGDGIPRPADCNDADPAVHPGANEDLGPVDFDCDGYTDPAVPFEPRGCAVAPDGSRGLGCAGIAAALGALARRRRR